MIRAVILIFTFVTFMGQAKLVVEDAVVRLLPPGLPNTSAYFSVKNQSNKKVVLIGASAGFVENAEIHNHIMVNGMMRMQQQSKVVVEPGQSVQFAPGGLHIMLFGLKQPLQENQKVSLSLTTVDGESIKFSALVARPGASSHSHH